VNFKSKIETFKLKNQPLKTEIESEDFICSFVINIRDYTQILLYQYNSICSQFLWYIYLSYFCFYCIYDTQIGFFVLHGLQMGTSSTDSIAGELLAWDPRTGILSGEPFIVRVYCSTLNLPLCFVSNLQKKSGYFNIWNLKYE